MTSSKSICFVLLVGMVVLASAKPRFAPEQGSGSRGHARPRFYPQAEEDDLTRASRIEGDDYEDFPIVPPILRLSFNVPEEEYFKAPRKRYLGIDIPDYISTGGKADAIKSMSNKMKAMGKK